MCTHTIHKHTRDTYYTDPERDNNIISRDLTLESDCSVYSIV